MTQTKMVKNKTKVLVVGASFSGLHLVHHLSHFVSLKSNPLDSLQITLVDPKDYFEYTPGILHVLTGSKAYSQISGLLSSMHTDKCELLQGMLVGVQPLQRKAYFALRQKNLLLNDNSNNLNNNNDEYITCMEYDALVICTGTPYTSPIRPCLSSSPTTSSTSFSSLTYTGRKKEIDTFTQQLRDVDSVLIAGGGLVGVELAAEIVTRLRYNDNKNRINNNYTKIRKVVTLITRSKALVDTLPSQAGKYVYEWLISQGVRVILDDEIIDMKKGSDNINYDTNQSSSYSPSNTGVTVTTKSGHHISAGFYIDCTGRYIPPSIETMTSINNDRTNDKGNDNKEVMMMRTNRQKLFQYYLKENHLQLSDHIISTTATASSSSASSTSLSVSSVAMDSVSTNNNKGVTEGGGIVYAFPFTSSKSILVDQHFQALDFPAGSNIFSLGDCATHSRSLALACSTAKDQNQYAVPHFPAQVRNANFAGYEAKICAYNVMTTLQQPLRLEQELRIGDDVSADKHIYKSLNSYESTSDEYVKTSLRSSDSTPVMMTMKSYPEDAFGGTLSSLFPSPFSLLSSSSSSSSSSPSQSSSFYSNIIAKSSSSSSSSSRAYGNSNLVTTSSATTTITSSPVLLPLAACVSLGPHSAVLVLNNLVLGGMILGRIAAVVKFVIERSKVAELKGQWWARAFWSVAQGILHAKNVIEHNIWLWNKSNKNKNNIPKSNSNSSSSSASARVTPGFIKPVVAY